MTSHRFLAVTTSLLALISAALVVGPAGVSAAAKPASGNPGGIVTNFNPGILDPKAITVGPDGALWFTSGSNSIGRITTPGVVTDYTGPDISAPQVITAGPDGALWFTNLYGGPGDRGSIGRITTSGVVTNYTDTSIYGPEGITVGSDGALWFTNQNGNSIGRITTSGVVTNYTDPSMDFPQDIAAGPDGALWFTNNGSSIGRITTSGVVSYYSATGGGSLTAGPDGALWFINGSNSIGRITTSGVVTDYGVNVPEGSAIGAMALGPDGALWFSIGGIPQSNGAPGSIGRMTLSGSVTNVYTDPRIVMPASITAGPDGALWFTNWTNNSIGRITTSGVVSSYGGIDSPVGVTAGSDGTLWYTNQYGNSIGQISTSGEVNFYTGAKINEPTAITSGPDGALWFINDMGNSIGRVTAAGVVSNYSGLGITVGGPTGITVGSDGALWFTDYYNDSIGRITTSGAVTDFSNISHPEFVTAGPDGAMWFTTGENSIGRITTAGAVSNFTGTGIDDPGQITVGPDRALWFVNSGNNSIGRISTSGVVTNYTDPSISDPDGITAGPDGVLWFTNNGNNSIGRITTSGVVTNFTDPSIDLPEGIAAGPDGALWFTNWGNSSIGRITAPSSNSGSALSVTTSTPAASSIVIGSSNTDSVSVTGVAQDVDPTGTVNFYECGPTDGPMPCTSGFWTQFDAESLGGTDNPSMVTSVPFTPTSPGDWCFAVVYSGDANYSGSSDESTTDECFDVTVAVGGSTTTTAPVSSQIMLGSSNTDEASVTGSSSGVDPTGTVDFYECGPTTSPTTPCALGSWTPIDTASLSGTANPSTATSAPFIPNSLGYWCFAALYSGDSNYSGSSDNSTTDECFNVSTATSTVSAKPLYPSVVLDGDDSDVATVTGSVSGFNPTGSVDFYECAPTTNPTPCTAKTWFLFYTAYLSGTENPSIVTSAALSPTEPGYWCLAAVYSGDSNYSGSSDNAIDRRMLRRHQRANRHNDEPCSGHPSKALFDRPHSERRGSPVFLEPRNGGSSKRNHPCQVRRVVGVSNGLRDVHL